MQKRWKSFLTATLAATLISFQGTGFAEEITSEEIIPEEESAPVEETSEPEIKFEESISDRDKFDDHNFSIEGRFFSPHFDANVKSDKIYYNGGKVGMKDNLGFGNDNAPEIILRYKRLSIDYIHIHGSGHRNFSGRDSLTFGGKTYRGHVDSKNTLHYLKLNVTNPIKMTEDGGLTWSYGLTGMFWKGKVSGTETTSGRHESRSEEYGVPIPTLGIAAQINILPQFNGYAHISGMYFGHYGHFYDFEAGIKYKPAPHFAITAGYRKIETKVNHKDDYGKMKMNGPFAGVRFDF